MKPARCIFMVPMLVVSLFFLVQAGFAHAATSSSTHDLQMLPSCKQISPHLNLMTLSDTELLSYGLPTHASLDQHIDYWRQVVASAPRHECGEGKAISRNTSSHVSSPHGVGDGCGPIPGTQCQTSNWAGNLTLTVGSDGKAKRGIYRIASVSFKVPAVSGISGAVASTWTGVGGESAVTQGLGLVQAGIDVIAGQKKPLAWVQVLNTSDNGYDTGTLIQDACPVAIGHDVNIYVTSNENNDGYDYFAFHDYTTNCFHSCTLHTNNTSIHDTCAKGVVGRPQYNSDSATGECIVERLPGTDLAQFNPPGNGLTLSQCKINGTGVGNQSHFYDIIVSQGLGSHLIAGVGPITNGDTYTVTWFASS